MPATLSALVIDVRGNPGGDSGLADDLASALLGARATTVMTCHSPSFPDGYGPVEGRPITPLAKM